MTNPDFLKELKAIDPRLDIVPNPNRAGLSNIKLDGKDVCPIPSGDIKEEPDNNYRYEFPNGLSARHKSRSEALAHVHQILEMIKTPEGESQFFS
jgi:hypothetical protein